MLKECGSHGYFREEFCPHCGSEGKFLLNDEEVEILCRARKTVEVQRNGAKDDVRDLFAVRRNPHVDDRAQLHLVVNGERARLRDCCE